MQLKGWHYLLLPKLNRKQVAALSEGLRDRGFSVDQGRLVNARKRSIALHVDPSGVCWSSSDPSDFVVPLIPSLLRMPKERVMLVNITSRYFKLRAHDTKTFLTFSTRMEASFWWALRASGQCAVTPDERTIALSLLKCSEEVELVTDFPTPSGRARMIGKRQYYESFLGLGDARRTLSVAGRAGARNSYLMRGEMGAQSVQTSDQ